MGKLNLFTNAKDRKAHTKSPVSPQLRNPDTPTRPHPTGSSSGLSVLEDQKEELVDHVQPHPPHIDHQRTSTGNVEEKRLEGSQGSEPAIQPERHGHSPDHTRKQSETTSFSKSQMSTGTPPQKPAVLLNSSHSEIVTMLGELPGAASRILTGLPLYESPLNEEGPNLRNALSNGVPVGIIDLSSGGELHSQNMGIWEETNRNLEQGPAGTTEHDHAMVKVHITVDKPQSTLSVIVEDSTLILPVAKPATTASNLNLATLEAKSVSSSTRRKKVPEPSVKAPQDQGKQVPLINGREGSTSKDTVTHGKGDLISGPLKGVVSAGAVVPKQKAMPFKNSGDIAPKEVQSQRKSPNGNKRSMTRDSVEKVESSTLSSEGTSSIHMTPKIEAVSSAKTSNESPKPLKSATQDVKKGERITPLQGEGSSSGTVASESQTISSDKANNQSGTTQVLTLGGYGQSTERGLPDGGPRFLPLDTGSHPDTTISLPQATSSKKPSIEAHTEVLHNQQIMADPVNKGEGHVGSSLTEPGLTVPEPSREATLPEIPTTEEQRDPSTALTDDRLQVVSEERAGVSQMTQRVVGQRKLSADLVRGQGPEVHTSLPTQSEGQGMAVSSPQAVRNASTADGAARNNVQVAEVKQCTCSWWDKHCCGGMNNKRAQYVCELLEGVVQDFGQYNENYKDGWAQI
ncbi:hypothetical protein BDZ94DRAFT_1297627 [Collybia nuda]|uniref:Uncharacterized protein n=1 Tax=Collybia nuda TaxID=64659 RepID=A0A9P6CKE7_9AGAR|nr:hypothetical protein BDZ94DRAFT_1297627 [Collybia nuda]